MIDENLTAFLQHLLFDEQKSHTFWRKVGSQMVYLTQERIEQGVDLYGHAFVPSVRSGQTLRDTGQLFYSLNYQLVPDGVAWGTKVAYAPYLHYGATIKARNNGFLRFKTAYGWVSKKEVILPPRPFLGLGEQEKASVVQILTELLRG
ncbi:phage virion morphogenesis protein [Moraxella bovis]|uniref:phage virion morphogenesis protein n=1 Tax=Moraxella bovis TaxID=476 RepID=UPI002227CC59|nr:phage virion morphogenesis protein [Moraxella bovis]UYZ94033.1 phage virion morphogenesis protein [Moraxella bovis]